MGMYTLSVMTEIAPDAYVDHAQSIVVLLQQTLSSLQNLGNAVTYYLIKVLLHLIPLNKVPPANQIVRKYLSISLSSSAATQLKRKINVSDGECLSRANATST